MGDRLTVTAIVVVRNGERYIGRALDSILNQARIPERILVIDGQSTDSTREIADRYREVEVLLQRGTGIADAYNCGITESNTDLVAFLSHDDEWTSNKLAVQVDKLERNPEVMLTTARARFVAENPDNLPPGFRPALLAGHHTAHIMETLVARRELFGKVGLFDTSFAVSEDVDWFARVKDAGIPWAVADDILLVKHIHEDNTSLNVSKDYGDLLKAVRGTIRRKKEKR
jgi:glycosyltransferase involved in cell wall biosynthesis